MQKLKDRAKALKTETYALCLASKDPRVPWYAKALLALVVAYALSPIDLIPDFIPILGYLDDLIIVPAGLALVIKMLPPDILEDCRQRAAEMEQEKTKSLLGLLIVVTVWLLIAFAIWWSMFRNLRR